jgi:hypothetical protein
MNIPQCRAIAVRPRRRTYLRDLVITVVTLSAIVLMAGRVSAQEHAKPAVQDKWRVSEERSQMDNKKTVSLMLDSENLIQGHWGTTRPSLVVRCKDEMKTDVYVVTGTPTEIEPDTDYHSVREKLDNGAVQYSHSWLESTDHRALFYNDPSIDNIDPFADDYVADPSLQFAKNIAKASTLLFEFTPFEGSPQVARFDVRGLNAHLGKIAQLCRSAAQ